MWTTGRKVVLVILAVLALGSLFCEAIGPNLVWFNRPDIQERSRTFAAADIDDALFIHNVQTRPTFVSTFLWWHHNWIGEAFPFYWRPLTMQSYWIENRLFGSYRFDRWQITDITFYMLFGCLLAVFAARIAGTWFAAPLSILAMTSFAPLSGLEPAFFASSFTTPAANIVLSNWKDQPEMWTGLTMVGAMLCALNRRWWAAVALAAVSVCYKESGWMAFPLILMCALYTGDMRKIPKRIWIAGVATVFILVALRASAGQHVLFPNHDSGHAGGTTRYARAVFDGYLQMLYSNLWSIPILGFSLAALVFLKRPGIIARTVIGLLLFAGAGASVGYGNGADDIPTGIDMLIEPNGKLVPLIHCFLYGVIVILAFRYPPVRRQAACLYAMVLISAIPSCFVLQPNQHMLFLTNAFQSVLVAAVAIGALKGAMLSYRKPDERVDTDAPVATAEA